MGTDERFGGVAHPRAFHRGANALPEDRWSDRRFEMSVHVQSPHGRDPRQACVFDIGADGVFVCTHAPLEPGTTVTLSLLIPGRKVIEAEGTVVWANLVGTDELPEGMGVRFTRMDPVDRLYLRHHLTALA